MKKIWIYFLVAFLASSAAWGDVIRRKSADPLQGVVVDKETAREVVYRYRGTNAPQRIAAEEVIEIEYSNAPYPLKQGMQAYERRAYRNAAASFRNVRKSKFKPYGKYYLGVCLRKMKDYRGAIKAFEYFKNENHRLAPKGLYQLGLTYLDDNKPGQAERVFNDIEKKNYSDFWKFQANYGQGLALLQQKRHSQAKSKFEFVSRRASAKREAAYKELVQLAKQGTGLALVGMKNFRRANRLFFRIIKDKNSNSEALAGSYLGLGKVYYGMAKSGRDAQKNYKLAALCFLRVALYYQGYKDKLAEAVTLGAECFEKLGQADKAAKIRSFMPQ